jgi:hypothetical protein
MMYSIHDILGNFNCSTVPSHGACLWTWKSSHFHDAVPSHIRKQNFALLQQYDEITRPLRHELSINMYRHPSGVGCNSHLTLRVLGHLAALFVTFLGGQLFLSHSPKDGYVYVLSYASVP